MPRKPAVDHEDLLNAYLDTDGVLESDGSIPGPTHEVWKRVAAALDNKLQEKYLYTYFRENRHGCRDAVSQKIGVTPKIAFRLEEDQYDEDEDRSQENGCERPLITFNVTISNENWLKMKPITKTIQRSDREGDRVMKVLPGNKWENIVINHIWEQHRLPCPYTFRRSWVYTSFDADAFIRITAYCRECGAQAEGLINSDPGDHDDAILEWKANDTRLTYHTLKRPLRGEPRHTVGQNLQGSSASLFRKLQAKNTMDQGDLEPPNLWKLSVLRMAKQQERDLQLNLPKSPSAIEALVHMKHLSQYMGSIGDIGRDPFFVYYYSPAQVEVYKNFSHGYIVLVLDATGSLVIPLPMVHGESAHIMLYEGVIKAGDVQLPVLQMLSATQTANDILKWLNSWKQESVKNPNEVVIDNSPALKVAVVRAFSKSADVQDYLQKCFMVLQNGGPLPACFIRLDVAHFVSAACKWKLWVDKSNKRLKSFYIRVICLLIKATTLEYFKDILLHAFVVSSSSHEGGAGDDGSSAIDKSMNFLSGLIKGAERDIIAPEIIDEDDAVDDPHDETVECSQIRQFVAGIKDDTRDILERVGDGGRLNAYYLPSFAQKLEKLSMYFPMWTAVLVDYFQSPHLTSSSAAVESDFSDLKRNILKGVSGPQRVEKFVAVHLNAIEGACRIAGAQRNTAVTSSSETTASGTLTSSATRSSGTTATITSGTSATGTIVSTTSTTTASTTASGTPTASTNTLETPETHTNSISPRNDTTSDGTESRELNAYENWRKLGKPVKKRATYLDTCPQMDAILKAKKITLPKKRMLLNGGLAGFVSVDAATQVEVSNTCAFDVLCQGFAEAYIHNESCRVVLENAESTFLKTCKSLALHGAVTETIKLRAIALSEVLEPNGVLPTPAQSARTNWICLNKIMYDCWGSVQDLANALLKDTPSCTVTYSCSNNCVNTEVKEIYCTASHPTITTEGINKVAEALLHQYEANANQLQMESCLPNRCTENITFRRLYSKILLIDVDYFVDAAVAGSAMKLHTIPLSTVPVALNIAPLNYALSGVIARSPAHFVTYTRKPCGSWELANNLERRVRRVADTSPVSPVLLLYVQQ